jgi:hypothetical protein
VTGVEGKKQKFRHRRYGGELLYSLCMVGVVVGLLILDWKPTVDANIGAGGLFLCLLGLGFPWSLLAFASPLIPSHAIAIHSQLLADAVVSAAALVNVALPSHTRVGTRVRASVVDVKE